MTASKIWTRVDYEKDGKQVGWLNLPHSVNRSAYGNIAIPVTCIKNGKGPTVLLMSGTHGDEYEGQIGLCKLVQKLEPSDIQGRVIGIPTLGASNPEYGGTPASGIGFAIPSNDVRRIADQLIKFGKVVSSGRAYLGIRIATITTGGVIVTSLEAGGPAAKAGVAVNEMIASVAGKPTPTVDDLSAVLAGLKPGQAAKVELVTPEGVKRTVSVTLGQLPGS